MVFIMVWGMMSIVDLEIEGDGWVFQKSLGVVGDSCWSEITVSDVLFWNMVE